MARWQITIAQPSGSTPALPSLVLENFGNSGYQSTLLQSIQVSDFSQGGGAVLTGSSAPHYRRQWALAASVSEADALLLEALVAWQDERFAARADGRLVLTDEVEYLPPEPPPHSRTFLSGSSVIPFTGYTTGFGVHRVRVGLPEQHKQQQGRAANWQQKLIQITAIEVFS